MSPTEDSFHQHVLRALYQILICKAASTVQLTSLDVTCFGWTDTGYKLSPFLMTKSARPPAAVNKQYCMCVQSHCLKRCACESAGVRCGFGCMHPDKCGRVTKDESDSDGDDDV